jgi:RNA polymerase sigma-70 factor, ECF subfamily
VTGTQEDAEDVLQTIFLRLLNRRTPPDFDKGPKAYLYRAAVNLSLNTVRSRQRRVLTGDAEYFESSIDNANSNEDGDLHRRLHEGIAQLNAKAAEILLLRYVHNYSDAEIAKLLGTSRGTIAVSLFRSRVRLKKLIRASMEKR